MPVYYVFDTNIVSLLLRGNVYVQTNFEQRVTHDSVILGCPIVWYELRRGLLALDAKKQMGQFQALFDTFIWSDYTSEDWALASTLWAKRRALGLPIGNADLLIAVFARNRDAILVTDNEKDFEALDVSIENWTG